MKRICMAALLCCTILFPQGTASAAGTESVRVNGRELVQEDYITLRSTTYVALRSAGAALAPEARISWEGGQAVLRSGTARLTARPGAQYVETAGEPLYVPYGVLARDGRVFLPVRVLAAALGAGVTWDPSSAAVTVTAGGGEAAPAAGYSEEDLYWLSHIISAESRGEPLEGQIAVGNVVLNRVASREFPNTIKEVIFDSRWGGQFTPVRNGTIYQEPTAQSVIAARLVLGGADVAGKSLYFFAPALTSDRWISGNRTYVMTIGCHQFYS